MDRKPSEMMAVLGMSKIPSRWLADFWELDTLRDKVAAAKRDNSSSMAADALARDVTTPKKRK